MLCIIAAEPNSADLIKQNLEKMPQFKQWQFVTVNNSNELEDWEYRRPEVLVLSRYLPGEEHASLFKNLQARFPVTHIVLLVGMLDEITRGYIKMAEKYGLYNIVTGRLPGDKPYTLPLALTHPKNFEAGPLFKDKSSQEESLPIGDFGADADENEIPSKEDVIDKDAISLPELIEQEAVTPQPVLSNFLFGNDTTPDQPEPRHVNDTGINKIIMPMRTTGKIQYQQDYIQNRQSGVFALTTANKGGVGKTTSNITLGLALSRAGVKTVLWDLDFEGPDLKVFFNITDGPGIEMLSGSRIYLSTVEELLYKVNDNLYVLPGPMDAVIPSFQPGQLTEIVGILKSMFSVVIADTPPGFWGKPWLFEIFPLADAVFSIVDQSKFSEQETKDYAPMLLSMGVTPDKIRIILNRFSPKLHNARVVENHFCSGFKKGTPKNVLPKVIATIPEDWITHVGKGYKGEVVGLEDPKNQWHKVAQDLAKMAGCNYNHQPKNEKKKSLFAKLLRKND